jgi:hypothetical protein
MVIVMLLLYVFCFFNICWYIYLYLSNQVLTKFETKIAYRNKPVILPYF